MNEVLEPLVMIPGVRMAAIVSEDGVPICVLKGRRRDGEEDPEASDSDDNNAFVGLSTGWLMEVSFAVGQLAWDAPARVVLCASRGALVLQRAGGATLCVVLEHGISPDELRVPMDGATARMQRHVRGMHADTPVAADAASPNLIKGALPDAPAPENPRIQRTESPREA